MKVEHSSRKRLINITFRILKYLKKTNHKRKCAQHLCKLCILIALGTNETLNPFVLTLRS